MKVRYLPLFQSHDSSDFEVDMPERFPGFVSLSESLEML